MRLRSSAQDARAPCPRALLLDWRWHLWRPGVEADPGASRCGTTALLLLAAAAAAVFQRRGCYCWPTKAEAKRQLEPQPDGVEVTRAVDAATLASFASRNSFSLS